MSTFRTWEDLLEQEDLSATSSAVEDHFAETEPNLSYEDLIASDEVPEEFKELLRQKETLEKELNVLTGKADPSPDEERNRIRFPVFAHTKETRLQEKRLKQREERRLAKQKQILEQRILDKKQQLSRLKKEQERKKEQQRKRKLAALKEEKAKKLQVAQVLNSKQEAILEENRRDQIHTASVKQLSIKKQKTQAEEKRIIYQKEALKSRTLSRRKEILSESKRWEKLSNMKDNIIVEKRFPSRFSNETDFHKSTYSRIAEERKILEKEFEKRDAIRDEKRLALR